MTVDNKPCIKRQVQEGAWPNPSAAQRKQCCSKNKVEGGLCPSHLTHKFADMYIDNKKNPRVKSPKKIISSNIYTLYSVH